MGICDCGKTLQEAVQEKDRLFKEKGYAYGLERLNLIEADPARFMRFQMSLVAACINARETAKLISANPVSLIQGELLFLLANAEGDAVSASYGLCGHVQNMPFIVKSIAELGFEDDPGVRPGDIFSTNDPLYGTPHNADCYTFMPLFYKGELVGWTAGLNHITDVGGIQPGNMGTISTSVFTDGFTYPPTKTGENFKQHRWWDLHWKRRTRTEMFNVLDDKMRAAGIVTLHNLVQDIIKEFGIDYFRQGLREIVERERRVLVNRIRSLAVPGIYQWLQFRRVEYKGTLGRLWPNSNKDWILHKVAELSVRSDGTLLTDMEGLTSEDEFYCNCYEPGVRSMAALGMWPMFAYTKTVNSSLLYITDWNLPPGCMFNPQNPWAATVSGNAEAGALAFIYHNTLSLAYFARGFLEETMPADPSGGGYGLAGTFHDGFQWGGGDMTLVTCWGQAATAYRDGFPASNCAPNPQSDQGEVEVAEFLQPTQLNIGRKLIPDFCGHGKFRGALEMGMMQLVNKPGHALVIATFCSTSGMGAAATGMCGGYPRANDVVIYAHDTNVREILESGGRLPRDFVEMMKWIKEGRLKAGSIETFNGSTPTVPCKDGDLFASTSGSRGGWGDVLERPYELVQEDLKYGWITPHCASTVYGVSIDGNGKVDTKESDVLRKLLRNRRKERSVDARDWWNQERRRVREKEWHADVGAMYADCCKYPKFRKQFYGMWHLPEEHKV